MFQRKQDNRILLVLLIVIFLFIIIFLRVFYIEVFEYKKLNNLAEDLWSRNLPVEAERGRILDRNGKVIASNSTRASLVLVPNQIKDKEKVAKDLSKILNVPYEKMVKHVTKKTSMERVHPYGRRLTFDVADKINSLNYDGVYLLKESKRDYVYPETLSHVLGYVGIDNQGLSGLELKYDKTLTGQNGSIKYFSDGKGKRLELREIYNEPQSGMDLTLTIDMPIQLALTNELDNAMKKYNSAGAMGIVMNPKTGEILAMESKPSFIQNKYNEYDKEIINRNLAIWSNFEPGSTFKILTLAAAINEKKVNVFEDKFYDSGSVKIGGATLHCWKHKGHGLQTFVEVAENSCNPGFVELGNRLGKKTLFKYIDELGFGKPTGIDLNGESKGIIFDLNKVGPLELATTSFGQGVSVTAIQQVQSVSTIINDGIMMQPHILKRITEPNTGTIIKEVENKIKKENVITKESSDLVKYVLESVVANGSGRNAYIENYRVGGKTGTAQKVGENGRYMQGNYILSFIGFMPANDPEYVVYIAIDNPKGVTQYGGTVAAPIAGNVLKNIISIYNLKEDPKGMPREYLWYEDKYVTVPNIINKTKKEALKELRGFNIEYTGTGDTIIMTNPESGKRVKEGSTIKLMLN